MHARQGTERNTGIFTNLHNTLHLPALCRGDRQNNEINLILLDQTRYLGCRTKHTHALDIHSDLLGLVIDQTNRYQGTGWIAKHVTHQHVPCPACSNDKYALTFTYIEMPVLDPAIQHTWNAKETDQKYSVQGEYRA